MDLQVLLNSPMKSLSDTARALASDDRTSLVWSARLTFRTEKQSKRKHTEWHGYLLAHVSAFRVQIAKLAKASLSNGVPSQIRS